MMGILKLEGKTLGQKHQHYNKLLKEITSRNTSQDIKEIDYTVPDIDNLLKIDIASKTQDVEYILGVIKCEDMLYVSRALKQSIWLITDVKYANIINPDYLYTQLLPQMTSKAGNKLILTIRLNLKDEKRVEQFFKYYEEKKELDTALKWLPNCYISFIEDVVEKHAKTIPDHLIKRLCEKSITILEICSRKLDGYQMRTLLAETTFLLNNNAEKFVSIVNSQDKYDIPRFNAKATKIIMKIRPNLILDNFEKFAKKMNIASFVKYLKREDIKDFLLKHFENNDLKSWFTFEIMKHFLFRMPSEGRFDFIKRLCIEKAHGSSEVIPYCDADNYADHNKLAYCCASESMPQLSNANIYKWYNFAPFSIAFTELKKLIRIESNPSERNEIFSVLLTCTRQNSQNLHTVLQYYREKHMNEPLKFKTHFVNIVLSQSNSHRFDDKTWTILNDIFYSMEVYSENDNNIQSCLKYIIIYKIVHDLKVPEIVEKNFEFDTLKTFQSKLSNEEKEKVFSYLYQFITTKIQNITINSESDFRMVMKHIKNVLNLLNDWKKNLLHYNIIIEKIREIIKIKDNKSWDEDLSGLYNINKKWRKHMFKESLFLHLTQEACLNALKHGPEILESCHSNICLDDSIVLPRLLSKLRIYWPQTLAKTFEDTFRNQLNDITKHKMSVRGLCILLPKNQLIEILNKYKPADTKINWTETNDYTLSIQKCFAKYMLLARPHPPVDIVLFFAKGDYLQFILPSMHSILFNISNNQSIKHIPSLLDAPVSLQKHGLNIAFAKLKIDELLQTCLNIWNSTKNSSIRAMVFKIMFKSLCKEQNENKIKEIWHILDTIIDNLTADENRIIYVTLGRADKVPRSIKQAYCIKSYRYLRSLPPKTNCDKLCQSITNSMLDVMETIDLDFVAEVIFDSFDKKFTKEFYNSINIISTCLLSTKSEAVQTQRYEKIFVPLLTKYLTFIKITESNQYHLKYNFNNVLQQLHEDLEDITINKNMVTPTKLFRDIYNDLEKNFPTEDNYVLIMTWNLVSKFMDIIDKYKVKVADIPAGNQSGNESVKSKSNIIYLEAAPEFGKICVEELKEEIKRYFPSIYRLFSKALKRIFSAFGFENNIQLAILKAIQEHADIIEGHLLVVKLLPRFLHDTKEKEERLKICQLLDSHPSTEVKIHYQQMLRARERYQD